jgi:hypothetical protein
LLKAAVVASWKRMIAQAAAPGRGDGRETADKRDEQHPAAVATLPTGPPHRAEAVHRECREHDRQHDGGGRQQGDLGRLTYGEEVRREGNRPDDREDQEDGTGRDPAPSSGRLVPVVVADVVVFAMCASVGRGIRVATGAAIGHAGSSLSVRW